jgi:outer membrane receptor protein involved in Fe transport
MLLAGAPARAQSGTMPTVNNPLASNAAMGTSAISPSVRRDRSSDLGTLVSLRVDGVTLAQALQRIAEKSDLNLIYGSYPVLSEKSVALRLEQVPARAALEEALRGTDLRPVLSSNGQVVLINEPGPEVGTTMKARGLDLSIAAAPAAEAVPRRLQQVQEGKIEGVVTDDETGNPLPGVNVIVADLPEQTLGAATNPQGQFQIEGVPAGERTLEAKYIGYETQSRTVEVVSGETITVNFALEESAVDLEEVVVTGAAGQAQRKEIGNTVSSIDVGELDSSPVQVEDILAGAVAGVSLNVGEGMSGSGGHIRLRGNTSISQANAPLVYVDGLRIRSTGYPKNVPPVGYSGYSPNVTANPLNDLNPVNIDRVEIVKGAAATTLYGTEAAPGVIQVFTKEGSDGETQWSFRTQQGYESLQAFGPPSEPFYRMDPYLKRGHVQNYTGSVRGGSQGVNYFASGSYGNNTGVLPYSNQQKFSTRVNVGFTPVSDLNVDFNTYYVSDNVQNPPAGNNAHGVTLNAYRGDQNYFGDGSPETIRQVFDFKIHTGRDHFVIGGTANYSPIEGFSNRLRVGLDRADMELRSHRPRGFFFAPGGIAHNRQWTSTLTTFDFVSNYEFDITSDLGTRLSVGGQRIETNTVSVWGYAENFSSPGEPVLSDGSTTLSFEDRVREINAGAFAQGVFDYLDRYFLTVGLRVDGNSAFGKDFGLQPYPKVSLSYVISDESFWKEDWGSLKLRAAYGHAGQAPGTFDAVRTWQSQPWGNRSAFLPGNVGNPQLGPERTVETEGGFNLTTLGDRLSVDFTYYRQVTKEALLPVAQIPSKGFGESQLENVGKLQNSGLELTVDGTILDGQDLGFDLVATVTTNQTEALDLGNAPPFEISGDGWIEEGDPFPAIRGRRILNPNEKAAPEYKRNENGNITYDIYGPNNPTHTFSLNPTLRLPYHITLSARVQYQGGHYMEDGASSNAAFRGTSPVCQPFYDNPNQVMALMRARCDIEELSKPYSPWVYPADHIKLSSATLRMPLPFAESVVRGATFSLSVNNVRLWLDDGFKAFDPGMTGQEGLNQSTRGITEAIPAPYSVTATLDIAL